MRNDEELIKRKAYTIWKKNGEKEGEDLLNWILAKESLGMYNRPFQGEKSNLKNSEQFVKLYEHLEDIKNIFVDEAMESKSIEQILENKKNILGRGSLFEYVIRNIKDIDNPYRRILGAKINYVKSLSDEWPMSVMDLKKINLSLEEVENNILSKCNF